MSTSNKVTKAELIAQIAEQMGVSNASATIFLSSFIKVITENIKADKEVGITGFGTFKKTKRKARNGINPKTGEKIVIPAITSVRFTVGKTLKQNVQ